MMYNPIAELRYITEDMDHIENMGRLLIDAIYNGDSTTLQMVGNSMEIMMEQFHRRIDLMETLKEEMNCCFSWLCSKAAVSDKYYEQEFDRYISCMEKKAIQSQEVKEALRKAVQITSLLPHSKQRRFCISIKEAEAASRKQGFMEGYKAAVARCSTNGGAANE